MVAALLRLRRLLDGWFRFREEFDALIGIAWLLINQHDETLLAVFEDGVVALIA
jgi:hypothetical protein